ncbi:MAG: zinc-binding dehydrogenase [Chloroflexi bacterium]|nr:zinc-binding dehydrogenase [Chloroflexota bacterium]
MKAAIYYGPRDIRVEDIPRPTPGPNEVLVAVKACGICGSDLHTYRYGIFEDLGVELSGRDGRVMGHEFAGEVAELGPGVTSLKVGDRIGGIGRGAYSEYAIVEVGARSVHPLPDAVSFEEAATFEPFATSLHGVGLAALQPGETVVVLGAGIIGLGAVQAIRATTTGVRVIAVDGAAPRLAMARQMGADDVVDFTHGNPVDQVLALVGEQEIPRLGYPGGNVDAVIDCAGAVNSSQQGLQMLKQENGRLVLVALFEHDGPLDRNMIVRKHVRLLGSWAWTTEDIQHAAALVRSGKVDRRPLVSHTFPLDQAAEAFVLQEKGQAIKVVITP